MTSTTPVRTARSKSLGESLLDMARSLGLMAVLMAFVLFVTPARGLIFPDRNDRMPPVDDSSQISGFATLAHQPALAPQGLPSSWRVNAADLSQPTPRTVALHVGYVVGSTYAGLDESTQPASVLIAAVLGGRGAAVTGTVPLGGVTWQLRVSDLGERSLTRTTPSGVTVVVTGNARASDLDRLAASLR